MENLDFLVVLGARIGTNNFDGFIRLSEHLELRAQSAKRFHLKNPSTQLIVSGGRCFGIRYPIYLDQPTFNEPDFSEKARRFAAKFPSESSVIALWLFTEGVPAESMTIEEHSLTTTENAYEVAKIIREKGGGKVGVLSMAYHLLRPRENAMKVFEQAFREQGLPAPVPVFTEEILRDFWKGKADVFHAFYQSPRSGFLWPADQIYERLIKGESLAGLKPIKAVE